MRQLVMVVVMMCGCNAIERGLPLGGGDASPASIDGDVAGDGGGAGAPALCRLELAAPIMGAWWIDAAGPHNGATSCTSPGDSGQATMLFACPNGSSCFLSVTPSSPPHAAFAMSGSRCDAWTGTAELVRVDASWSISFNLNGCDEHLEGVLKGVQ